METRSKSKKLREREEYYAARSRVRPMSLMTTPYFDDEDLLRKIIENDRIEGAERKRKLSLFAPDDNNTPSKKPRTDEKEIAAPTNTPKPGR